jgi:hypothetical protein
VLNQGSPGAAATTRKTDVSPKKNNDDDFDADAIANIQAQAAAVKAGDTKKLSELAEEARRNGWAKREPHTPQGTT